MKPWISWMLFFIVTAGIAFFSGDQWSIRFTVFLILTIPITFWAMRQARLR